jgi:hypothetical protein
VEAAERRCRSGVETETLTAVACSRRSRRPPAPAAAAPAARRRAARRGLRNILARAGSLWLGLAWRVTGLWGKKCFARRKCSVDDGPCGPPFQFGPNSDLRFLDLKLDL